MVAEFPDDIKDAILAVVQEGFDSQALRPGGSLEADGLDWDWKTLPLYNNHDLGHGDSDTEHKFEIGAGESRNFVLSISQKQDDPTATVTGVQLNAPAGATVYSMVEGPSPTGGRRSLTLNTDLLGTAVGRFSEGHIVVRGTIENGGSPGIVELVYGAPQDQADLPGDNGSVTVQDPDIVTGTDSLHVDTAGVYEVTVTITVVQDTSSATVSGISGAGYIRNTPSSGPINDFPILQVNTPIIE